MTRYLFLLLSLIGICTSVSAQSYRNEWIDYNKSYYKFKIGPFGGDAVGAPVKNGIVRIPQNTLSAAGLGNVPVEQLQLWRNGEEVPVYTSKQSGVLSPGDYIEFWGDINDGKLDKEMYRNTAYQLSDYWSLHSDSGSYFLTVNPSGNNKRFTPVENDVNNASISAEKNFMFSVGRYYRADINPGYAAVTTQRLYSSAYDRGESWTSRSVRPNNCGCSQKQMPQSFPTLYADMNGGAMTVKINSVGNALNPRNVQVYVNNAPVYKYQMDYFSDAKAVINDLPVSMVSGDAVQVIVENQSPVSDDEFKVVNFELIYPRKFNFGGATSFMFDLPASDTGRYLKIYNFSRGTSTPVLYDLTNGTRYVADMTIPDTLRFLLNSSASDYHLVLARNDGSAAKSITTLQTRNFIDYSKPENQGNYLIISNPLLYGSGNYVEQYRQYRSSAEGGSFNATVIDIDEITDQFAYGVNKHPLSIKNFLLYARNNFSDKPKNVFLIGKAVVYSSYKLNETNATANKINLVPTWGNPGSDNFLTSEDSYNPTPLIPIGRLSAVSPKEVGDYLAKIKEYEAEQHDASINPESKEWMKNVLHIVGANDDNLGPLLDSFTNNYTKIISDTSFGGYVTKFSKAADPSAYPQSVIDFKSIYEKGSSLVEYFGHSSSTSLDFNLDNPSFYNNEGKYPVFIVNGCLAGNIFDYDGNRLNTLSTVSEKFVLAPQRGAIGYLSTSSYGIVSYLDAYTENFYKAISSTSYGEEFGKITQDGINQTLAITGLNDFYGRIHAEQFTFHGDPALKMNSFNKPDFLIEQDKMKVIPSYVSVADDSFSVKIHIANVGKATSDSVLLHVYKKRENISDNELVYTQLLPPVKSMDSVIVTLPIVANRDKGIIVITASIDANNKLDELYENNNTATINFLVHKDDIRPVFPYNYAIVNADRINLVASTADPLADTQQYLMEIDTTALFNSPLKNSMSVVSKGGVIYFNNVSLPVNKQVYFWRVSQAGTDHWNGFSFTCNTEGSKGFEQASYYQHKESSYNQLDLDSSGTYNFSNKLTNVYIVHSIYPTSGTEDNAFSISLNGSMITASACVGSSIIFNVFDTITFKPEENKTNPFGAGAVCDPTRKYNFEFSTQTPTARRNAMNFLDAVPNGKYVIVRKIYDQGNADWAPTVWAKDTALFGRNNSLYHRLKEQGVAIDSFKYPRTFVFVFRKNDSAHFTPVSVLSQGLYDRINMSLNIVTKDTVGYITSPKFGPAKAWNKIKWNGFVTDNSANAAVDILGETVEGQENLLYTLDSTQKDFNISGINSTQYPFLKLRLKTTDTLAKPFQLQQWSAEYQPVAEGAIAPNIGFNIPDTVSFNHLTGISFDTLQGYVVFKNVSESNLKPLKVKIALVDSINKSYTFDIPDTKALAAGDTLNISFLTNLTSLPEGKYNLLLQVNSDNAQLEQYSFNNNLYKYVYVQRQTSTLPVRLLSFMAKQVDNTVKTEWMVATEINLHHYTIEHSTNGRDFSQIGLIYTKSNNAINQTYNCVDIDPLVGKNYYRLKMTDNDGSYTYSPVRLVNFANTKVSVFPNPFLKELKIVVNKPDGGVNTVCISSVNGEQLLYQSFSGAITVDASKFPAANYLVKVDDGSRTQTFIVQKAK